VSSNKVITSPLFFRWLALFGGSNIGESNFACDGLDQWILCELFYCCCFWSNPCGTTISLSHIGCFAVPGKTIQILLQLVVCHSKFFSVQVSPIFKKNFSTLVRLLFERHPFETMPVSIPVHPWVAPTSPHTFDVTRAEDAAVPIEYVAVFVTMDVMFYWTLSVFAVLEVSFVTGTKNIKHAKNSLEKQFKQGTTTSLRFITFV
jgi:hypothetical protein